MSCRALRSGWALVACAVLAACSSRGSVDDALLSARPHLPTFARFERWVHQARGADIVPTKPGALAEAIFAPLRAESSVLAAFVRDRSRGNTLTLAMPEQSVLPAEVSWVAIRNAELGTLRVASFETCPVRARRGDAAQAGCVMLEKESTAANGDALSVSIVFRSGEQP